MYNKIKTMEKLTSVKVDTATHNQFKMKCITSNCDLHKLVNRSMHLFVTDENYRNLILNPNETYSPKSTI